MSSRRHLRLLAMLLVPAVATAQQPGEEGAEGDIASVVVESGAEKKGRIGSAHRELPSLVPVAAAPQSASAVVASFIARPRCRQPLAARRLPPPMAASSRRSILTQRSAIDGSSRSRRRRPGANPCSPGRSLRRCGRCCLLTPQLVRAGRRAVNRM